MNLLLKEPHTQRKEQLSLQSGFVIIQKNQKHLHILEHFYIYLNIETNLAMKNLQWKICIRFLWKNNEYFCDYNTHKQHLIKYTKRTIPNWIKQNA